MYNQSTFCWLVHVYPGYTLLTGTYMYTQGTLCWLVLACIPWVHLLTGTYMYTQGTLCWLVLACIPWVHLLTGTYMYTLGTFADWYTYTLGTFVDQYMHTLGTLCWRVHVYPGYTLLTGTCVQWVHFTDQYIHVYPGYTADWYIHAYPGYTLLTGTCMHTLGTCADQYMHTYPGYMLLLACFSCSCWWRDSACTAALCEPYCHTSRRRVCIAPSTTTLPTMVSTPSSWTITLR